MNKKYKFKEFASSRYGSVYRSSVTSPKKVQKGGQYPNGFCVGERVKSKPGVILGEPLYATIVDDWRNEQSATEFWAEFDEWPGEIQWDVTANYEIVESD